MLGLFKTAVEQLLRMMIYGQSESTREHLVAFFTSSGLMHTRTKMVDVSVGNNAQNGRSRNSVSKVCLQCLRLQWIQWRSYRRLTSPRISLGRDQRNLEKSWGKLVKSMSSSFFWLRSRSRSSKQLSPIIAPHS